MHSLIRVSSTEAGMISMSERDEVMTDEDVMGDTVEKTMAGETAELEAVETVEAERREKRTSIIKDVWSGIYANKASLVSLVFIIFLALIAIITRLFPQVLPFDPNMQNLSQSKMPPSAEHWFGTDLQGRDVFCRVLVGTQISLTVGFAAVAISLFAGVMLGTIAGYRGGITDTIIMRIMDMVLAIPSILLAIAFMAALGRGVDKAVIAIGLVSIPEYARIVRSEILSIKENDYVAAARVIGDSDWQIIFRHVLPNALPSIIVRATLGISTAVLDTAALGFLGLGVQPPFAEWGDMLGRGRSDLLHAQWLMVFPGLAIMLTVLAFNLLGNGIRDGLDPKTQTSGRMLLEVKKLTTVFPVSGGLVTAVDDVSFSVDSGQTLAIVGESGSGKSVTALSIIGLLSPPGRVDGGQVLFEGNNLLELSPKEYRALRGNNIAMIFQEPMTSLNPVFRVGEQIAEAIRAHTEMDRKEAMEHAIEMLYRVGIPSPSARARDYPHQLSGGMRQRVMIAMALSCNPRLLIADEPTTALDVTIQAQILELINRLQEETDMSVLLVTHDLGVVSEVADQVAVMYCGRIVEASDVRTLFFDPKHPYTMGLLKSVPQIDDESTERLYMIKGSVPNPLELPAGCSFSDRCDYATAVCREKRPEAQTVGGSRVVCHLYDGTEKASKL